MELVQPQLTGDVPGRPLGVPGEHDQPGHPRLTQARHRLGGAGLELVRDVDAPGVAAARRHVDHRPRRLGLGGEGDPLPLHEPQIARRHPLAADGGQHAVAADLLYVLHRDVVQVFCAGLA